MEVIADFGVVLWWCEVCGTLMQEDGDSDGIWSKPTKVCRNLRTVLSELTAVLISDRPLDWSGSFQSYTVIDFMRAVDNSKAIREALKSLGIRWVDPQKD